MSTSVSDLFDSLRRRIIRFIYGFLFYRNFVIRRGVCRVIVRTLFNFIISFFFFLISSDVFIPRLCAHERNISVRSIVSVSTAPVIYLVFDVAHRCYFSFPSRKSMGVESRSPAHTLNKRADDK